MTEELKQAAGWAVIRDGKLDIESTAGFKNDAARMALALTGAVILQECHDPANCTCMIETLAKLRPSFQLVPIVVKVRHDA